MEAAGAEGLRPLFGGSGGEEGEGGMELLQGGEGGGGVEGRVEAEGEAAMKPPGDLEAAALEAEGAEEAEEAEGPMVGAVIKVRS